MANSHDLQFNGTNVTNILYNNSQVNILKYGASGQEEVRWARPFTYSTGTLPTGVASITCYRQTSLCGASTGVVANGATIYYGDGLYFTATAASGYNPPTSSYPDSSHLLTVNSTIIGATYITPGQKMNFYASITCGAGFNGSADDPAVVYRLAGSSEIKGISTGSGATTNIKVTTGSIEVGILDKYWTGDYVWMGTLVTDSQITIDYYPDKSYTTESPRISVAPKKRGSATFGISWGSTKRLAKNLTGTLAPGSDPRLAFDSIEYDGSVVTVYIRNTMTSGSYSITGSVTVSGTVNEYNSTIIEY